MANAEISSGSKINFRIIDWMRGLAALYVLAQHARGYLFADNVRYEKYIAPKINWNWRQWLNTLIVQHTNLGKEFVIVFFVLSGFCIMHSVSAEPGGKKGFFQRRLLRLYPTYLLGIAWAIAVFLILKVTVPDVFNSQTEGYPPLKIAYDAFVNIKTLSLNLVYFIKDNYLTPQYWSLPLEVIFYLSIPFFARRFNAYTIFSIVAFVISCIWTGLDYLDENKYDGLLVTVRYIFDYNIYFFIGCIFYKYRDFFLAIFKMDRMRSIVALMLVFLLSVFVKSYLFEQNTNKATGLLMVLFTYIMLIAGLKHQVRIKLLEWVGGFSYTLYVSHLASLFIVKIAVYKMGHHFYDIFLVYVWYIGVVFAVLVAWLLYYIAEYPSKRYLTQLRNKPTQQ
ncbi:MAG: hypothetical protein BGO69_04320 [Bacteroidetes bacterium 46-16]|nr:MAG: hypothetical protein BGO69_04320 [Bacteroidetes bacterium 46-16]